MTTFPPPPRFRGHENCEWDGLNYYERECTPEEAALLDAHQATLAEEERRQITDRAESKRDSFFEGLRRDLAGAAAPIAGRGRDCGDNERPLEPPP
jgi:hypothetical protein